MCLSVDEMAYTYRHCGAPDDFIFVEAVFQAEPGEQGGRSRRK